MIDLQESSCGVGNAIVSHPSRDRSASQARLVAAMEEVMDALAAGQPIDREALLAKYADVADELAECLSNLDFVQNVAPQLADEAAAHPASSDVLRGSPDPARTTNLGDFRILREIGRGGMGVVYEAEQLSLGRRVALKVLPFAAMLDKQQLARFKNEARAAATLDHPNIVAIYSVGVERGVHYYAMQLIDGQSLAQVVDQLRNAECGLRIEEKDSAALASQSAIRNPQSEIETSLNAALSTLPDFSTKEYFRAIAQLGIQAAEALDHAHQNGILHRDIKPANLLVDDTGKLWITDFGLARMEQDAGMTMTGDILGTLRYMSPEQALAKRVVVDHRSDIYSLGVTLYELLTLQSAFTGDDRQELLRQIAFEEPRKPRQISARIPQDLETIIHKAIEKNPADRYGIAQQLADDLRRFVDNRPIVAKQPNMWVIARKWSRRNRPVVVSAAVSVAALVLISLFLLASSNVAITRERNEKAAALQDRTTALGRSEWNYEKALDAINRLLARVGNEKLAEVPQLDQLRMDVLKDTLEFYELFLAKNPDDPKLQFELAKTYRLFGTMHHDSRRFIAAKWYRGKSIEMLDELHTFEPSNPAYRYELAVVLFQQGWTFDIPSCFPRSIELFEALVNEFPDNISYREGLADALRSYFEAFATEFPSIRQSADTNKMRSLVESTFRTVRSPGVYQRFLAHAFVLSGGLAVCERRLDDAEADYREAIRAFGEAVAARPTDSRTRQHYMRACQGLASFLEERGDDKQAEYWYRKAIELGEELTHDFPRMRLYRIDENECVAHFVRLLKKQSRVDDATEFLGRLAPIAPLDFAERARLYAGLGQHELAKADYEQALKRSQQELQADPTNPTPYETLFDGLMQLGRREEALVLARNMPTPDVESLGVRAALYQKFGSEMTPTDSQVMIDLHSQLVDYFPTDMSQLAWRAVAYMRAGQNDKALLDADKAIEAYPNFPLGPNVRGLIYLRLQRYDEAIGDFSEVIRLMPKWASNWDNRAQAYNQAGRYDEALADINEAIKLDPFLARPLIDRAYAYLKRQQNDEALKDLKEALLLEPTNPETWNVRGIVYGNLKQFEKAVEDHTEAIRLHPNAPPLISNRAKAYTRLRLFDKALDDCNEAIRIDPEFAHAWNVRGHVHLELKQFDKAIEDLSEAYRLDPTNVTNLANRGAAHIKLNQHEQAIEDYSEAIQLVPKAATMWTNRGTAYRNLARYQEAIDDYDAALAIDEDDWLPRINLAWLLATADEEEYRDGKRALDLAQSTYDAGDFGSYGEARFLSILAAAHAEVGDFEKAIECCRKAIEMAKDDDELLSDLKKHLASYQASRPWRIGDKIN
jgi:serine/threonine protein kinase/Flp pilus assembly protein TadD